MQRDKNIRSFIPLGPDGYDRTSEFSVDMRTLGKEAKAELRAYVQSGAWVEIIHPPPRPEIVDEWTIPSD